MAKYKVVVTDYNFPDLDIERQILNEAGAEVITLSSRTEDELIETARDANGIIDQFFPISSKIADELRQCKVIAVYGVGTNQIDLEAVSRRGILVANVPDYCTDEVSTHAIALLLSWSRRIPWLNAETKNGKWSACTEKIYRLAGQTVGLAGFGRIARLAGSKLKGLGVRILAYDPYVPSEIMSSLEVDKVELDELLTRADYVLCHLPLTAETQHLFSEAQFRMMKRSAVFINTARGGVVDENALYRALTLDWIAGAALDVLEEEPPSASHPLVGLNNVIITPHAGWYSEEANAELRRRVAESVLAVLKGRIPGSIVNVEQLKRYSKMFSD